LSPRLSISLPTNSVSKDVTTMLTY
jgi:hypothetical protein